MCPTAENKKPLFGVPSIREYFVDLDYVLGVISDGPAKSFAFRRLKYLSSQFTMYSLLNEYQELADMKVNTQLVLLDASDSCWTARASSVGVFDPTFLVVNTN
jgi:hypothetical protein